MAKNKKYLDLLKISLPYVLGFIVFLVVFSMLKNAFGEILSVFGIGSAAKKKKASEDYAKAIGSEGDAIRADALRIAEALGVNYSWFNPVGYFQDRTTAYNVAVKYDKPNFILLSKMYALVSGNRDLMEDLIHYLPTNEVAVIQNNVS